MHDWTRTRRLGLAGGLALATLLLAGAALAGTPGANTRQSLLPLGECTGLGQAPDGDPCIDAFDCEAADGSVGQCTTPLSEVAIRGVLWLIADKDAGPTDDLTPIPLTIDERGDPVPSDLSGSTLTLMLEFTRNGEKVILAETYKDLPDFIDQDLGVECLGFCMPLWREDAVESRIADVPGAGGGGGQGGGGGGGGGGGSGGGGGQQGGTEGIRILWATLPPAANEALKDALGLPADALPFLEVVSEKDVFDRSDEDDLLASVRRMKVTIRAILGGGA